jgi:hypothetical protein
VILGLVIALLGTALAVVPSDAIRTAQKLRYVPFPENPSRSDWRFARLSGVAVATVGAAIAVALA